MFNLGLKLLIPAASNANCHVFALDDHRKGGQTMQLILSETSCVMHRQTHRQADDCLHKLCGFHQPFSEWRDGVYLLGMTVSHNWKHFKTKRIHISGVTDMLSDSISDGK